MTNSSSDEEKLPSEEREKIYEETGVDEELALKALLTDIIDEEASSKRRNEIDNVRKGIKSSSTSHKPDADEDGVGGLDSSKKLHRNHKKRQNNGSDENDSGSSSSSSSSSGDEDSSTYSSSDSELDNRLKSIQKNVKKAEVIQKLQETINASSLTSGGNSLSDNHQITSGSGGSLKRLPGSDLSTSGAGASAAATSTSDTLLDSPAAKKPRADGITSSASSSNAPVNSSDNELVSTVRKYLMRKPITVRELLKKIRLRKLVGKNEDAQTVLANVLRQLRPIKQTINGQHVLSLK
ncbi:unnamed protein product [Trichobilharzia regenti]|nr:unnamed protein product [Trichobilharzia regenti]